MKRRLAGILSDTDCLLHDAILALAKHVNDPSGRNDPVIDSPREVYEFLQLWIGVHAEALATSRGFIVVGS